MNVNQKGQLALAAVVKHLAQRKWEIYLPIHDYGSVDMIAIGPAGQARRIQVKHRVTDAAGRVDIELSGVVNGRHIRADHRKTDLWEVYLADVDTILYIPTTHAGFNKLRCFRVKPTAFAAWAEPI